MKKIFLIDGDNNINLGLRGIEMLTEENHVMIFHSKAMEITKFKKKLAGCRAHIDFIESVRSGKNSLDFQITTELGFLSHNKDLECAYIISCDKGYDAAVDYVKSRYSAKFKELDRRESIFDCFQLAFALKAKTKGELSTALVKEYGPEHGLMVYNHLKTLFGDGAEEAAEEKILEKAEKKVAEVQTKVKKKVSSVVKKESVPKAAAAPAVVVEEVSEPVETVISEEAPVEKKSARDRRKTRPERKPKAASARTKKAAEPEEMMEEKVEEKVESLKGYDIPLRFGAVRTDEQNQSFYKSKDLRKKSKAPVEVMDAEEAMARGPEEAKVEEAHVEAVVEMINDNRQVEYTQRPQRREGGQRNGDRRSSGRGRDGQRRPRREAQGEGKVVPMKPKKEEREAKATVQQKPVVEKTEAHKPEIHKPEATVKHAEVSKSAAVNTPKAAAAKKEVPAQKSAAPAKKASGQNTGFFGRMFGRKKK